MSATALSIPRLAGARRRSLMPLAIIAGALVVALVVAYIGSNVWASVQQRSLEGRFDAAAASWAQMDVAARSHVTVAAGDPIARLEIPRMGLRAVVVEGAGPGAMRRAPGHLQGSATPGENGVAIITANRLGFGSFFLRLDRLEIGDRIVVDSPIGRTTFSVTEIRTVPAERLDLATDSSARVLVLFGSGRLIGGGDRLVVHARADEGTV